MGAFFSNQKCGCYSVEYDGRWGPLELTACADPGCDYRKQCEKHPRFKLLGEGREPKVIPEKGTNN